MNKQKGFLLRLPEEERQLAKQLANELGCSENRLYSDLIHDGLLTVAWANAVYGENEIYV